MRYYAVATELVAAILYLNQRSSMQGHYKRVIIRSIRPINTKLFRDETRKLSLLFVAYDKTYSFDLGKLAAIRIGVAAGSNNQCIWVAFQDTPYKLTRLVGCNCSDRTAVDNIDIGLGREINLTPAKLL